MPSKPAHPAFVHFPIAFLMLGFGLDIVYQLSPQLPRSVTAGLAPSADLNRGAYYLISMGLLAAIPAVVSGGREAVVSISKQGLFESDGKTIKNKFKATIAHAVANDIVILLTTYIWYTRRTTANNTIAGKLGVGSASTPAAAYAPETWMVVAEAALVALLAVASNIGGVLAYNFGIGFQAMSSTKKGQ